jgi:hypothetical protein
VNALEAVQAVENDPEAAEILMKYLKCEEGNPANG